MGPCQACNRPHLKKIIQTQYAKDENQIYMAIYQLDVLGKDPLADSKSFYYINNTRNQPIGHNDHIFNCPFLTVNLTILLIYKSPQKDD